MAVLPLYYQIKQTLKNRIINREYSPGEKIPSEFDLASQFKVSRLTVRQALSQLAQEGFLTSKRGLGTFVTRDEKLFDNFKLEFSGYMDGLFYHVQKAKARSVEMAEKPAPEWVKVKLKLPKECKEVVEIKRVRFLKNKPFSYSINYLPLELGRKIPEAELFKKPLLQILEKDIGLYLTEAFQVIDVILADEIVAEKLGVESGLPILFIERIMYIANKTPVEIVQSFNRADMYKYIVRLKRFNRGKNDSVWLQEGK